MLFDTSVVGPQIPTKTGGAIKPRSGITIEALSLTGGLDFSHLSNITVRHCRINANSGAYGVKLLGCTGIRIERCEIFGCESAAIYGEGFTAQSNIIHHSAGDGFKPTQNATIAGNWVHHLGYKSPGAHADGVQIRGGSNIAITGNYFDLGIDVPDTHANSSLMVQLASRNVQFTGNVCRGGNFILNGDAAPGCVCSKKIFIRHSARYGFFHVGGMQWMNDNTFDDGSPCAADDR